MGTTTAIHLRDHRKQGDAVTRFIQHRIQYEDDEGQVVVENCVTAGDPPEGWVQFVTPVQIVNRSTGQPLPLWYVHLPADTIEDAFEMCRARVKAAVPKIEKAIRDSVRKQQQQLVVPGCEITPDAMKKAHNGLRISP